MDNKVGKIKTKLKEILESRAGNDAHVIFQALGKRYHRHEKFLAVRGFEERETYDVGEGLDLKRYPSDDHHVEQRRFHDCIELSAYRKKTKVLDESNRLVEFLKLGFVVEINSLKDLYKLTEMLEKVGR